MNGNKFSENMSYLNYKHCVQVDHVNEEIFVYG